MLVVDVVKIAVNIVKRLVPARDAASVAWSPMDDDGVTLNLGELWPQWVTPSNLVEVLQTICVLQACRDGLACARCNVYGLKLYLRI